MVFLPGYVWVDKLPVRQSTRKTGSVIKLSLPTSDTIGSTIGQVDIGPVVQLGCAKSTYTFYWLAPSQVTTHWMASHTSSQYCRWTNSGQVATVSTFALDFLTRRQFVLLLSSSKDHLLKVLRLDMIYLLWRLICLCLLPIDLDKASILRLSGPDYI